MAEESIASYVAELKRLAATCEFNAYYSGALRDRFVCGIRHQGIQKKLLTEKNLSFEKAVKIALIVETAERSVHELNDNQVSIDKVQKGNDKRDRQNSCTHCGRSNHASENCWLKEAICFKCEKRGHIYSQNL